MKKKSLYIQGMAALLLCGCSSEESDMLFAGADSNVIEIGTYIKQGTRAAGKSTFADGDAIGLYACQTTGDYADAYTANYMNNVVVTNEAGAWTYSPLSSWITDPNEHLSFVAFYPHSSTSTALVYPFTIGADENGDEIDPLWCTVKDATVNDRNGTAINGNGTDAGFTATGGPLTLKFKHMLSRVKIKVKLDAAYPEIDVNLNSLALNSVYTQGTYTIAPDLASGTWGSLSSLKHLTIRSADEGDIPVGTTEIELCDTLMIPQTISDTPADILLSYTHTLAEGGERTVTKTIYLPGSWEQNKLYNYVVSLSLDVNNITVSATINDMENTTDPSIGDKPAEAVDLGLSVKWASYDYGAMSPYDVSPEFKFFNYNLSSGGSSYTPNILSQASDRASSWGSNWFTPTREQWSELMSNCTVEASVENGVSGYRVSATNGNSIFLGGDEYWTSNYYYYSSSSYYYFYYYKISTKNSSTISGDRYNNIPTNTLRLRPVFK